MDFIQLHVVVIICVDLGYIYAMALYYGLIMLRMNGAI